MDSHFASETSVLTIPSPQKGALFPVSQVTDRLSMLDILSKLGSPAEGICRDHAAVTVSRYFAPNREEASLTYGELFENVTRMASVYRGMGLGDGSKIAMAETNSLDFFGTYFGGLAVGATMVPINLLALQDESSKTRRLVHMLATPKLGPQDRPGVDAYVLGADPMFEKMQSLGKILKMKKNPLVRRFLDPVITRFGQGQPPQGLDGLLFNVLKKNAPTPKAREDLMVLFQGLPASMRLVSPQERNQLLAQASQSAGVQMTFPDEKIADILYTSGTSGNPKGVALTHGNLAFSVKSLTDGTEDVICDNDVLLMGLPFFHIFGKAVMLTAFSRQLALAPQGGRVEMVLLPSLSKAVQNLDGILKTIQEYGVTILPAVPVFLEKLVAYLRIHPNKAEMLSSLKTIISGGAGLKVETYEALKNLNPSLRIIEGYGSSEGGINLLNKTGVQGYVGTPLPGNEIGLEGSSEDPSKGELLVRSDGVSAGYVEGTTDSKSLTIADESGWFRTGDVVSYDPNHGFKIIGRDSFFIKIDNEKRSPGELEEAVKLAHPSIVDVMVVPHLAGSIHEMPVGVVVTPDTSVTEASLKTALYQLAKDNQITRWKIPKHLIVLHQETMPPRFDNGFKRDAGYKVVREFFNRLVTDSPEGSAPVALRSKGEGSRWEWTEVLDTERFHAIAQHYNTP